MCWAQAQVVRKKLFGKAHYGVIQCFRFPIKYSNVIKDIN